jgi:hypothetical protein
MIVDERLSQPIYNLLLKRRLSHDKCMFGKGLGIFIVGAIHNPGSL